MKIFIVLIPLYFIVDKVDGFIEEKKGSKYLNCPITNSNKEY